MDAAQYVKSVMVHHNAGQVMDALHRCHNNPNAAIAYLANLPPPPNIQKNKAAWFKYFDPTNCGGLTRQDLVDALHLSFGSDLRSVNFEESMASIWPQFVPVDDPSIKMSMEVFIEEEGLGDAIAEYIAPIYLHIDEIGDLFPQDMVVPRQHIHDILMAEGGDKDKAIARLEKIYPLKSHNGTTSHSLSDCLLQQQYHLMGSQASQLSLSPTSVHGQNGPGYPNSISSNSSLPPPPPPPLPHSSLSQMPRPPHYASHSIDFDQQGAQENVYRPPINIIPPIPAPPFRPCPSRPRCSQKALLVGCNYVGQDGELQGCANDVLLIKSLLTKTYMWPDDNNSMRILSDGNVSYMQPTKENILNGLKWLVKDVLPGDALFFHFSGHGSQQPDPHGVEEDGMNEVILPVDYRLNGVITDDLLSSTIVHPLPDGVRLTVVMDACHSGTGCDLPYMWDSRQRKFIEETNPYHSLGDVTLFSGCMDSGTSCDVQCPVEGTGGAMTMAFVSSLQRNPHPTYDELLDGLLREMKRKHFLQKPQLSSSQEFDVGRPFLMNDALPNSNCFIGRTMRKKFAICSSNSNPVQGQIQDMATLLTAMLFG